MTTEESIKPCPTKMPPIPKPPPPHMVIVGGGLAGLAVASVPGRSRTADHAPGEPARGWEAGPARSPIRSTGELVDNCQHVSMACCTNLADFCRRVGIDAMLRREPELVFLGPEGRISRFRAGLGPAPFHLAGSFLSARFPEPARQAARGLRPGLPGLEPRRPARRVVRRLAAAPRPEPPLDQPVLGRRARLGPERAARPDGRRPRAQGLPRRLPPQPDGVPDGAAAGPAGRALRHPAGGLAARSRASRSG